MALPHRQQAVGPGRIRRLISAKQEGGYAGPSKLTVAKFLDQWLADARSGIMPRVAERYVEIIVPAVGAVHLVKLQPAQIAAVCASAFQGGRRDGKGGLPSSTVLYMHRVSKQALGLAVR